MDDRGIPFQGLTADGRRLADAPGDSSRPSFFHDLQCLSGFGDRLLDLWGAATIARLSSPETDLAVRWDDGLEYEGFVGTYDTDLFAMAGCSFVTDCPRGAIPMPKVFSHSDLNEQGMIELEDGASQIVLRGGMMWGTSCPIRLHSDLAFFGLDSDIALQRVAQAYREVAQGTEPAACVASAIPTDIGNRVGVHVRLHDKVVEEETPWDMSADTWQDIERAAYSYIDVCIAAGEPLFVCSDDASYRSALLERATSMGGDVVVASPGTSNSHLPGYGALVDFFALSRCRRIVQMTKYSTFSMAAAMVADVPLLNLYRDDGSVGHRLNLWRNVLTLLEPA